MSDRVMGGVGLALSIFYIWAATIIPESFMSDVVGPKTFPYIVGLILGTCSVYFVLRPDPEPLWPNLNRLAEIFFAILVMLAYAWVLPKAGFLIATAVATTYLTWRLGSRPLGSVITGVLTSVGIYVVFRLILGLSLAKGPLGF